MEQTCEICNKSINLSLCDNCKNKSKSRFFKFASALWTVFKNSVIVLIIPILLLHYDRNVVNTPDKPIINSALIVNTGTKQKNSTPFKLESTSDPDPWVTIKATNSGSCEERNLKLSLKLLNNNTIKIVTPTFYPSSLRDYATNKNIKNNNSTFEEVYKFFQKNSSVDYKIETNNCINSENDYEWSIISDSTNWTEYTKRRLIPYSFLLLPTSAYAESNTNSIVTNNSFEIVLLKDFESGSGVTLGGYDPVLMANGLFVLLQRKSIISYDDALEIKNSTENSRNGVTFSGSSVSAFCEILLNKLIYKKFIDFNKATELVNKSKNSGGILIGGVNIIILQVEILNYLLENGRISLEEGQSVIDKSKK